MLRLRSSCALAVSLAACGGGSTSSPDAGADAVPRGTVTVSVQATSLDPTPVAGAKVVFDDVDGTQTEVTTDANGKAEAPVARGASVTAVYELSGDAHVLASVLDVAPGDALTIARVSDPDTKTSTGTFTVTVPPMTNAVGYRVYGPCGAVDVTGTTATLAFGPGCLRDPMDLVAVAYDSDNAFGSVTLAGVHYTNGGHATFPSTWQAVPTLAATYTDVPASGGEWNLSVYARTPDLLGYGRRDDGYPTNATQTLQVAVPAGPTKLIMSLLDRAPTSETVYQVVPGDTKTYSLDVGASLLPTLSLAQLSVPAGEIVVTSKADGTTATADAWEVGIDYSLNTTTFEWTIWGGGALDAVKFPALPADLASYAPQRSDSITTTYANLFDVDGVVGWDAIRADVFTTVGDFVYGRSKPAAGAMRYSTFGGHI
jgi:hypothetical protein